MMHYVIYCSDGVYVVVPANIAAKFTEVQKVLGPVSYLTAERKARELNKSLETNS